MNNFELGERVIVTFPDGRKEHDRVKGYWHVNSELIELERSKKLYNRDGSAIGKQNGFLSRVEKQSLFDERECYTEEAHELRNMAFDSLLQWYSDFLERGYHERDITYVLMHAFHDASLKASINKQKAV